MAYSGTSIAQPIQTISIGAPGQPLRPNLRERLTTLRSQLGVCLQATESIQNILEPRPTEAQGAGGPTTGPLGVEPITDDLEAMVQILSERLSNIHTRLGG